MMKSLSILLGAAYLAVAAAPATADMAAGVKQFHLISQNGSGQDGTVTMLGKADGTTIVRVRVSNPGDDPQPAHIHKGPCSKLDPKPAFALTPLVGGISTTTVNAPIGSLVGHGYAVNVHKSVKEASVYVSCGDLT